ncbi:hypothetical protein KKG41_00210 [Patescibacteria group bacterium]|nr:hypothetical protein [Patescibacteria group bacterium]MBU1890647.1 hypothetical protein [Patescibacteria group bacterium]
MINKQYINSISIIVGTAVGAGIFALPYAMAKAGVGISLFYLVVLGLVSIVLVLAYGEVILRTNDHLQIIGYTKKYLGNNWRVIALVSFIAGITGALIAYTIQVGEFLETLLGPMLGGSASTYSLVYFIIVSLIVLAGLGMIVQFEKYMVALLILVVCTILFSGFPKIEWVNLTTFNAYYLFLPYGVILFAISAASAIPDAKVALKKNKKLFSVIKYGMIVPLIIYILFSVAVVGISGAGTHEGAIPGLTPYLGNWVVLLGILFGIIAMTTSFLTLGLVIREIYQLDFKIPRFYAWLMAMIPPFLVVVLHLASFVSTISLVGGVMGGFDGIIVLLMWRKARNMGDRQPECKINIPFWIQVFMLLVFSIGIVYELYYHIFA